MLYKVANTLTQIAEGVAMAWGKAMRADLIDYSIVETNCSETVLVSNDNRYVSGFEIEGASAAMGSDEFEKLTTTLWQLLTPFMNRPGHTVQIFGDSDKHGARTEIRRATAGARRTTQRLGLDFGDVLDARENTLAKVCKVEKAYIALWTHPDVLSNEELKSAEKKKRAAIAGAPSGLLKGGGQDVFAGLRQVAEAHDAFTKAVAASLTVERSQYSIKQLSAHEMNFVSRKWIDPDLTPDDWTSCLVGDPIPGVLRGGDELRDFSLADIQYPPLRWQLFPSEPEKVQNKYLAFPNRIYAPVYIETAPRQIHPFAKLSEALQDVDVPWRVGMHLDSGGLRYNKIKASLSGFLTWASQHNDMVREASKEMSDLATRKGVTYVRYKSAFCTWVDRTSDFEADVELLRTRATKLANAITGWGKAEVRTNIGNPGDGFFAVVPFLSPHCHGVNPSVGALADIVRMMPLSRQRLAWSEGSVMYRTPGGILVPFEPGSSKQDTWVYLNFAPPGSGKSVQMAGVVLGMTTQAGITDMPRIGIIDIGPSTKGLIELHRDRLPADRKHHAQYIKFANTSEFGVNMFDTFLGCRKPTPEQREQIVNVVTQLVTPAERDVAYPSTSEFAGLLVDNLYEKYSDEKRNSSARLYERSIELEVDRRLEQYDFTGVARGDHQGLAPTWWSVVDFLMSKGHIHEATLAQRQCVPTMDDVPQAASEMSLARYQKVGVETGENLPDAIARMMTSALRNYPILQGRTKFDLGDIRLCSIDLDDVAKGTSREANRQRGLMYLIARYVLTKDYKINKEWAESSAVPELYRKYWMEKATKSLENLKWILFDEFHSTGGSETIRRQVECDMREGRKWNLGVILASQQLEDFPETMRKLATGVFIYKVNDSDIADQVAKLFSFSSTTSAMIKKYCHGPTEKGAPMMMHLKLKGGDTDMLVYSTLGPLEYWALSTTAEDRALRRRVADGLESMVGERAFRVSMRALAQIYPTGCKKSVEALQRSTNFEGDQTNGAIQTLAEQVIARISKDSKAFERLAA